MVTENVVQRIPYCETRQEEYVVNQRVARCVARQVPYMVNRCVPRCVERQVAYEQCYLIPQTVCSAPCNDACATGGCAVTPGGADQQGAPHGTAKPIEPAPQQPAPQPEGEPAGEPKPDVSA
jgi:hypothetical protein